VEDFFLFRILNSELCVGTDSSVWDALYENRRQYPRSSLFFRGVWALIDISWITKPSWKHPVMTQCWSPSLFVLHKIQFGLLSTLPPPFFNVDTVISWMGPFYVPCLLPPSTPFSSMDEFRLQWKMYHDWRVITTARWWAV